MHTCRVALPFVQVLTVNRQRFWRSTVATAEGAAAIHHDVLRMSLCLKKDGGHSGGGWFKSRTRTRTVAKRRPGRTTVANAKAPSTVMESIGALVDALWFTYSETLGKWPLWDLVFGIKYLMRRQGNVPAASIYGGSNCVELRGPEIIADLKYHLKLMILCRIFSKKPFPVFLKTCGISAKDVLIQKPKAGLLKPAFTIIREENDKCFLLLIRGTHSIKDTLTAATVAVVPFHHSVLDNRGMSNLVLGYAHCGMVAAARWIAKVSSPCLLKALGEYPDYQIKVVGHSLGGGTAALLTYILRESKEFSTSTCITFAAAACMTWDLAESGKHFVNSIINGSDVVPTFSVASFDDLRSEVASSSWFNDLRDQVRNTRVVSVFYRSVTAIGSRLPSMARVAGTGARSLPVFRHTQVVMKRVQSTSGAVVWTRTSFSAWSCMGARRRKVGVASISNSEVQDSLEDAATKDSSDEEKKEITREELSRMTSKTGIRSSVSEGSTSDSCQFYPPGRTMHIVAMPMPQSDAEGRVEERLRLYETPRELYGKMRLSRTMIEDHYMPVYRKTIESLISQMEDNLVN